METLKARTHSWLKPWTHQEEKAHTSDNQGKCENPIITLDREWVKLLPLTSTWSRGWSFHQVLSKTGLSPQSRKSREKKQKRYKPERKELNYPISRWDALIFKIPGDWQSACPGVCKALDLILWSTCEEKDSEHHPECSKTALQVKVLSTQGWSSALQPMSFIYSPMPL